MRYVTEPRPAAPGDEQADSDPEQVARIIVLRRLSISPRTRKELADDLRKRGVDGDVAERVLSRFAELGLIDDAEYARMWVDSRQRTRGSARSVLQQELRARGVCDDDARAALEAIDDDDERARAARLVEARLEATRRLEPQARRRRLVGLLVRRGYRQSMALSVVAEAIGSEEATADVEPTG
jgi:regulatory protein